MSEVRLQRGGQRRHLSPLRDRPRPGGRAHRADGAEHAGGRSGPPLRRRRDAVALRRVPDEEGIHQRGSAERRAPAAAADGLRRAARDAGAGPAGTEGADAGATRAGQRRAGAGTPERAATGQHGPRAPGRGPDTGTAGGLPAPDGARPPQGQLRLEHLARVADAADEDQGLPVAAVDRRAGRADRRSARGRGGHGPRRGGSRTARRRPDSVRLRGARRDGAAPDRRAGRRAAVGRDGGRGREGARARHPSGVRRAGGPARGREGRCREDPLGDQPAARQRDQVHRRRRARLRRRQPRGRPRAVPRGGLRSRHRAGPSRGAVRAVPSARRVRHASSGRNRARPHAGEDDPRSPRHRGDGRHGRRPGQLLPVRPARRPGLRVPQARPSTR